MKQQGLGIARWLILLFALAVAFSCFRELREFKHAMYRPAEPAPVLAAHDDNDKPFILKPVVERKHEHGK